VSGPDHDDEEGAPGPQDNPFKAAESEGRLPGDPEPQAPREPPPEDDGDILTTAEPFHPARDADDAEAAPPPSLPPPPARPEPAPEEAGPEAAEADEDEPPPSVWAPSEPAPAPEPLPAPAAERRRTGWLGRLLRRLAIVLVFVLFIGPVATTLVYRIVPPPVTFLMLIRLFDGHGLDHRWRPMSKISPALARAVIGAEDQRFCQHHGFDFEAMEKALAHNEKRPGRIRGGSTISQQTAKNVFLWPDRSYVRKGLEAWFTVLIETLWGKRRIMEVYLNSIEWGPGIYGAEAAAQRIFGVSAAGLNSTQAARLAAILPRPLKWQAAAPGAYVARRSRRIGAAEGTVDRDGLDDCLQ
jgi:monofunctional biosynthetic peptidoglycan transglycosylase